MIRVENFLLFIINGRRPGTNPEGWGEGQQRVRRTRVPSTDLKMRQTSKGLKIK